MKQQTINIPEGFELIQTTETTFEIKKKEKVLPKTWEEFCRMHDIKSGETFVDDLSQIIPITNGQSRHPDSDRNLLPNKSYVESVLALMQLIQLRDYYNAGWKPDWTDNSLKYTISNYMGKCINDNCINMSRILVFKSKNLRNEFFNNFIDLIEIAKDFI